MMSTARVELANFINPDLTWKTVSKGSRSGTRRTRKPVSRKMAVEVEQGSKDATASADATVSESEKVGVAILGRRFSEKIEHVPIKKRRIEYFPSSPPPPQTPSPHPEFSEQHEHDQSTSDESLLNSNWRRGLSKIGDMMKSSVDVSDNNFVNMMSEKPDDVEDFSGIEILAAAACSDCIGHDDGQTKIDTLIVDSKQEGTDSLISETLVGTSSASQLGHLSAKVSTNESKVECSSAPWDPNDALNKSPCGKRTVESSISLPEDRSLWDLNLTMDAWERPCASNDGVPKKISIEDVSSDRSKDIQIAEPKDIKIKATDNTDMSIVDDECVDFRALHAGIDDGLDGEGNDIKQLSVPKISEDKSVLVASDKVEESVKYNVRDADACTDITKVVRCLDQALLPQTDDGCILKENIKSSSFSRNTKLEIENGSSMVVGVGQIICVNSVQEEESKVASSYVPVLGSDTKEIEGTTPDTNSEDCGRDAGPFDIKPSAQVDNFQPGENVSVGVEPEDKDEGMEICHASWKCDDFSKFASPGAHMDVRGEILQATPSHPGEIVYSRTGGCEESLLKSPVKLIDASGSSGFDTQECQVYNDALSGKFDKVSVDVCQTAAASQDTVIVGGTGDSLELQAGYDSQFEDGELREQDVQCWEDIEQVDYDTEGEEERLSGVESETIEKKLDAGSGSNAASADGIVNIENCSIEGASMNLNMKNGNVSHSNRIEVHGVDGLNARSSHLRLDGSKASSDGVRRSRSSNFEDSHHRAERDGYSDKFLERDRAAPRLCGRSPRNGRVFNRSTVYWDSKQQHSPVHRDPYNPVRSRPRNVVENHEYVNATDQALSEAAGAVRTGRRTCRQILSPSSGVYRPHIRRSPVVRDDSYGMHTRMSSLRDSNPDRSLFRRYTQNGSRAGRDEYLRHIADSTEYFSRMTHRLGRRERSGSPSGGRSHYASYRTSRSRSRSRSPMPWLPQRDRNEGCRHRSRSPSFKSDAGRMDRDRLMFPKRFASDYKEGFMLGARSRVSPQHNKGPYEDRNADFDHFRNRKSPVRMFRQTQRFDYMGSGRRLDTDGHFRRVIRPRRFHDTTAPVKGCKYEGGEDDKHGGRYDTNHRGRQYDTDGTVRRFQYNNTEDSLMDDEC